MVNEPHGQFCPVDRSVDHFEHIGDGSDMVLVSMGDHKALYFVNIVRQIRHVRDHQVNAQHIIAGESQAAVHDDDAVLIFDGSHVHSDLLQTSQGDDLYFAVLIVFVCVLQVLTSIAFCAFLLHALQRPYSFTSWSVTSKPRLSNTCFSKVSRRSVSREYTFPHWVQMAW